MKWFIMAYSPTTMQPYLYAADDTDSCIKTTAKNVLAEILTDNKDTLGVPDKIKIKNMFDRGIYQLTAIYASDADDEDDIKSVAVIAKTEDRLSLKFPVNKPLPDIDDTLTKVPSDIILELMS